MICSAPGCRVAVSYGQRGTLCDDHMWERIHSRNELAIVERDGYPYMLRDRVSKQRRAALHWTIRPGLEGARGEARLEEQGSGSILVPCRRAGTMDTWIFVFGSPGGHSIDVREATRTAAERFARRHYGDLLDVAVEVEEIDARVGYRPRRRVLRVVSRRVWRAT